MKRAKKIALLNQVLQGNVANVHMVKQAQRQKAFVFTVDETPKGWFGNPETDGTPVKTTYQLKHGTEVTEYLTYGQMRAKAKGGVLLIIPDNHRRKRPTLE